MTDPVSERKHGWVNKFSAAFSGAAWAIRTQNSCWVHVSVAIAVVGLAAYLQVDTLRFAILILAIALVLSLELMNSAIEEMVRAVHPQLDPRIKHALDAAAGAVLVASIFAAIIGLVILLPPLIAIVSG